MRTFAVVNQKGGCGKTTTAINLAAELASRGHRTLLVDMDPQSHCAAGLGVPQSKIERDMAAALVGDVERGPDPSAMLWEVTRNLYLAPSSVRLAALEAAHGPLAQVSDRDRRLTRLLARLAPSFEYCFIDCPPTLGILTFNALRAADEAIIPVETGFLALEGAENQLAQIRKVSERVGRVIPVRVLPTLHKPDRRVARDVMAEIQARFGEVLVPVTILDHDELREAVGFGRPVREHSPGSRAASNFAGLADWLIKLREEPSLPLVEVDRGAVASMLGEQPPVAPSRTAESSRQGSRVAELVERMRRGVPRDDADSFPFPETSPPRDRDASSATGGSALLEAPARPLEMGVSFVAEGVRFVQPAAGAARASIRADFGSLFGTGVQDFPMRRDADAGIFELLIGVPPGRYEYRVVVDGVVGVDPFNLERISRPDGESNLLRVPGR